MKESFMMNFSYKTWYSVFTEDKGKSFVYHNSDILFKRTVTQGFTYDRLYKYYKEKFKE